MLITEIIVKRDKSEKQRFVDFAQAKEIFDKIRRAM